jgi:RNA polymerase sigma factor (sigma-70 family)
MPRPCEPLLDHVRRITETAADDGAADAELLGRFIRCRDQDAFAALVRRHGPLVLRVCRRVLGDRQIAEDAFQAVFLILARKGPTLTRPEALPSWLHGVAFRVARKARCKLDARPTRSLPANAALGTARADPLAELTARELLTVVDEEIARLPEAYRLPVILCCLEGQSLEEAAQRLGWSQGSVKGRLERGRWRLHARLTRRGITLPLALAALEVSRGAAPAVSALLAGATARAAWQFATSAQLPAGLSSTAVDLAQRTLRELALAKLSMSATAAVLITFVGAGVFMWCTSAAAPPQSPDGVKEKAAEASKPVHQASDGAKKKEDAEPPGRRITITGRVVNAAGKPVAGAAVYVREQPISWTSSGWRPSETRNIADAASGADGQFAFRDIALPPTHFLRRESFPLDIVVHAPGHALAWRHVAEPSAERPVVIALTPEAKVQGRLIGRDGKPTANVAVRVSEIARLDHEKMAPTRSSEFVDLRWSNLSLTIRSDAAGRLRLPNLPREARVTLTVIDPAYVREEIFIATTETPQPPLALTAPGRRDKPATATVHHGEFTARVEPAFRLRAAVVFDDTGEPALGARWAEPPIVSPANRDTDKMARFALDQLAPGQLRLGVYPPENSDYMGVENMFDFQGEPRLIEQTVRLPRGVIAQGRVVAEGTGKGLAGAELFYFAKFDPKPTYPRPFAWQQATDAEGRFRLAVPPGPGNLLLLRAPAGFRGEQLETGQSSADAGPRYLRSFDASTKDKLPTFEFVASRGVEVSGKALAPDGAPAQLTQIEELASNVDRQVERIMKPTGEFHLRGMKPETQYQFAFVAQERRLAAIVDVAAPKADAQALPLQIKLAPMASLGGRVIDEDGKPIANAVVHLYQHRGQGHESAIRTPIAANPDGTFLWKELVPGADYSVAATPEGYAKVDSELWKSEAGQVHNLPDLITIKADQFVAGVLLDAAGKPLPGIAMHASYRSGAAQVRTETRLTDLQGRFRLSGLPNSQVNLSASNSQRRFDLGRVAAGKQDLRIVLDVDQ